jgi:hypothetical protein
VFVPFDFFLGRGGVDVNIAIIGLAMYWLIIVAYSPELNLLTYPLAMRS